MFKTISAEIKKIVSKPGIYILSILLATILVCGVFLYEPKAYASSQFVLAGDTYLEKMNDFMGNSSRGEKAKIDTKLDNALLSIEKYTYTVGAEKYTYEEFISNKIIEFQNNIDAYRDCATDGSTQDTINRNRTLNLQTLEAINSAVETAMVNYQYGAYALISTNNNYVYYKESYTALHDWLNQTISKANLASHFVDYDSKLAGNFFKSLDEFKYPTLSNEFVQTYTSAASGTKYAELLKRQNSILQEIDDNYVLATANVDNFNLNNAKEMDRLANLYVSSLDVYVNLIENALLVNAFDQVSTTEQMDLVNLSSYSKYNCSSLLEKYTFLFDENKVESDFSLPLTIGIASNSEANGYDYSYFVLRVFSFIIIVYAIMSCCHSIAGEINEGSMRYLAIRPVKRTKIFFGKWLAVIIMCVILMIFSMVISLCVGMAVYGMKSAKILTIFNGTTPIVLHPLAMIGIYMLSMLFELMIYSLLAMLLSVLFKSDLLSVTLLLMLYLLNTLLPMLIQGANSWLNFYPFTHISLYALFGSSLYAQPNNLINLMFGAKVYSSSHIVLTGAVIALMIIIISALAAKKFKNKEL